MRAGHWHVCRRADTGFHRVLGIYLDLSVHLVGILGMSSYPQCTQEEIKVVISGQAHPCSLLFGSILTIL